MATVEIQLASVLASVVEERRIAIEAETLRGALDALAHQHPRLALHLFDESGGFRPHVLCFLNETNTRWLDNVEVPVKDGDTLLFMQAVSGG